MKMRNDFCVFILTNGRPDRVYTYNVLERAGYKGKVYIVIDNEDKTEQAYKDKFGDKVLVFDKEAIAKEIDIGDNFDGRASTVYPRAAFWYLAKQVGCRYFLQLDDDYTDFQYYFDGEGNHRYKLAKKTLGDMFEKMLEYYISIPAVTLAMAQGGDFIGGAKEGERPRLCRLRRKAMNVFFCDCERKWNMFGRRNEDVNAYVLGNLRGELFFTAMQAKITQVQSQRNDGLITQSYLESGTYVKSFYTVMYAPSCTKIGVMGDTRVNNYRIHHKINWHNCAPKIMREEHKKA
jgi:hypothetical protein